MADITVAEFRERFTSFSELSDSLISELIPLAYSLSDTSRQATLYCVAHLAALQSEIGSTPDGGSGVVSSEQIGTDKVTYVNMAKEGRGVFFERTSYGRLMLAAEATTPKSRFSVRVA